MTGELIVLTTAERHRFVAYLRQEARTELTMAEQTDSVRLPAAVSEHRRATAAAYLTVAEHLAGWEEMTVG